jgi:hypothetical protein
VRRAAWERHVAEVCVDAAKPGRDRDKGASDDDP